LILGVVPFAKNTALADLNARVERGEIPDNTVDSRLGALLTEYGRRRHNLMVDLYERNRDVPHDMLNPSPNRTISFQDEIDLLKAAHDRARDPSARAVIEARIADLEALMAHEYDLFRSGEHDALIAGIAGAPRVPGETVTSPMTPTPRTLRPHDEVAFGINWMAIEGYRNIPIVDARGGPLGVLTVWDVMRHLGEIFDEDDATPELVVPQADISSSVEMADAGGEA
jgi:hypothetical protein